jgi:hypothetical protein
MQCAIQLEHTTSVNMPVGHFARTVAYVNVVIFTYNNVTFSDVQINPENGTDAFGSGLRPDVDSMPVTSNRG